MTGIEEVAIAIAVSAGVKGLIKVCKGSAKADQKQLTEN